MSFWNIRGISRAPNLKRLRKLVKLYSVSLVAICEPKTSLLNLDSIHVKVGMDLAVTNQSSSVLILDHSLFDCHTIGESE